MLVRAKIYGNKQHILEFQPELTKLWLPVLSSVGVFLNAADH